MRTLEVDIADVTNMKLVNPINYHQVIQTYIDQPSLAKAY